MDESLSGVRACWLREEAVPMAGACPGFVTGYWTSDPETGKGHTLAVFDAHAAAAAFKALVESRAGESARAGVTQDVLALVEVDAAAGAAVSDAADRPHPSEP
ncbi:hypothetical protein [Nocardiopsis aegyptia]|uniref:Monooxygenase n=1 Tax=Nocardiopsis aegyptia TaxID=220378 RepID=A0A7Z0J8U7_9ACTN|nr:hypothetical protein [Nocardiopsis aegyptia]NYJ33468.1 hypothetical protein [Nocardiopsis aegyptia]